MFGLLAIDILVIIVYFIAMIGIGLWSMSKIKNQEDYFLGGRRFGKIIQTFAAFGQSTTADNSVGAVTTTFTNGIAGIWSSLLYLLSTPIYWMISPWMRRLRLLTLGDFFGERYGSKRMAATYAVLGSVVMMAYLSVGFSAMSKTVSDSRSTTCTTISWRSSTSSAMSSYHWMSTNGSPMRSNMKAIGAAA